MPIAAASWRSTSIEIIIKGRKKEEGRRKKEEGRRKNEEGRGKKEDFTVDISASLIKSER
ncbi:MAG: hypothetical protein ACRC62_11905 [Microcoleus sp.]